MWILEGLSLSSIWSFAWITCYKNDQGFSILALYFWHLLFSAKSWLSITMLCPVGTLESTGRIMSRHGLISLLARPEDVLVSICIWVSLFYFPVLIFYWSQFNSVVVHNCGPPCYGCFLILIFLAKFLSKAKESCEDFPTTYSRPIASNCSWTDPKIQHEG